MRSILTLAFFAFVTCTLSAQDTVAIEIAVRPERPFIEKRAGQQVVNFDLLLRNRGPEASTLIAIKLSVFDRSGHLELKRELNENGTPPALDIIGKRVLGPGELIDIYQPFYTFGPEIDLSRMHLEFLLMRQGNAAQPAAFMADETISVDVHPRTYSPAAYCLPLRGLVLVHDGHDFYSHHRRYNLVKRYEADRESAVSANLYAFDFMSTTGTGALYKGDPKKKENWLTYGKPILAPADGRVIEVTADLPENSFSEGGESITPAAASAPDPNGFGNHVKMQHDDGRVSWLLHMKPQSITVKSGDRVTASQLIGNVGFSGDSLFPHLHYNVTEDPGYPSQGMPVYFRHFVRVLGDRRITMARGQVDTGDLLEQAEGSCR